MKTKFNVSVPAAVQTSEQHFGPDEAVRYDCAATVCGIMVYSTCNGHYESELKAIVAGKKAVKNFARQAKQS